MYVCVIYIQKNLEGSINSACLTGEGQELGLQWFLFLFLLICIFQVFYIAHVAFII